MKRLLILFVVISLLITACASATPAPQPTSPAALTTAPNEAAPTTASASASLAGTGVWQRFSTIADYEAATGNTITEFHEAPGLADQVKAGALPPVQERLPEDVMVMLPANEIGTYGGTFLAGRQWVGEFSHEFPFSYDATLNTTAPNILKDYQASADGKVYTFFLRKGMKWSDGEPVTADDVVLYYDHVLNNPDYSPEGRGEYKTASGMATVKKIDDFTIEYTFQEPNGLFPIILSRTYKWILPWHYVKQFHPDFAAADDLNKAIAEAGVPDWRALFDKKSDYWGNKDMPTLWAFKLVSDSSQPIQVIERNPYYWKVDPVGNQLPYIDSAQFEDGMDREVLLVRTIAGELDYAAGNSLDLFKNYPLVKENQAKEGYQLIPMIVSALTIGRLQFNYSSADPVLQELYNSFDLRKALSLGTDREAINGLMFNGLLVPSQWAPTEGEPYNGDSDLFKQFINYDPDAANALLDGLGLTWNADKTARLRPDGKPLELVLYVKSDESAADLVAMAEIIKSQWEQKLGIQVVINPTDKDQFGFASYTNGLDGVNLSAGGMGSEFPASIGANEVVCPREKDWPVHGAWSVWLTSGGAEGTEPPAAVKDLYDLCQQFKAAQDSSAAISIENEITALHANNLWVVGLLQRPAAFYTNVHVISGRMGNVPNPISKEHSYVALETWYIKP